VTAITDRDRRRACRLAHVFGAATAAAFGSLLAATAMVRTQPLAPGVLLAAGLAIAAPAGLLADLVVRPPLVLIEDGWLTVSMLGRRRRVDLRRLAVLSACQRVAGAVMLADEHGNQATIDVRCLARNPLIWQQVATGVSRSQERGSLVLAGPQARFWAGVAREVAAADRRVLAALDFDPAGPAGPAAAGRVRRTAARPRPRPRRERHGGLGAAGLSLAARLGGSALLLGWLTGQPHDSRRGR